MPFRNYAETRPWAKAIRQSVITRKMPPWFADPGYGHFANDRSLSDAEIDTLAEWADTGAPAGDPKDAPPSRHWTEGWNIGKPDAVFEMPKPCPIPARGASRVSVRDSCRLHFSEDKWVERVEVRPSNRATVHHAVVYIREPGSKWLAGEPAGELFALPSEAGQRQNPKAFTTSDILMVYTPGNSYEEWHTGIAKKIPAGSDLVLQMHYTANGTAASDRTSIGVIYRQAAAHESGADAADGQRSIRNSARRSQLSRHRSQARCRTTRFWSPCCRTCTCAARGSNT